MGIDEKLNFGDSDHGSLAHEGRSYSFCISVRTSDPGRIADAIANAVNSTVASKDDFGQLVIRPEV